MSVQAWTYLIVGLTFGLYVTIAVITRVKSTKGFYVAGQGVPAIFNGMATGADWMSAASFISMAGIISFMGFNGSQYLMGWTGGYVLLALLLAPYLRKFGKYTVPDFVGDRYYSNTARVVAVLCAIFVSFTYVAGQMRGVGIVFARFLEVPVDMGVIIGMILVFLYATLGGMKGITWTQVAQYVVLIIAFLIPAVAISGQITGTPIPHFGLMGTVAEGPNAGTRILALVDQLHHELGFSKYTQAPEFGSGNMWNLLAITLALMAGTAGLPHVIIRFYTTKNVRAARWSAFWAILFIAILYTTAPAVAVFARANLIQTVHDQKYQELPPWFQTWEDSELLAWVDKNGDGRIQYHAGAPFTGKPVFAYTEAGELARAKSGEAKVTNEPNRSNANELYVDRDIMVLANPEIANLAPWVIALVAAGGLAAALSTAAGLLLVISSAIAHDLGKNLIKPQMEEAEELWWARGAAAGAVMVAGLLGIYPPDFVAAVVAFAFGLAAASFFPAIVLGIFSKRTTKEGAIIGMLVGLAFTVVYISYFKFQRPELNTPNNWLFGIAPEGIGTIGMLINFTLTVVISRFTPAPPAGVQQAIEAIRSPRVEVLDGSGPPPAH